MQNLYIFDGVNACILHVCIFNGAQMQANVLSYKLASCNKPIPKLYLFVIASNFHYQTIKISKLASYNKPKPKSCLLLQATFTINHNTTDGALCGIKNNQCYNMILWTYKSIRHCLKVSLNNNQITYSSFILYSIAYHTMLSSTESVLYFPLYANKAYFAWP